MDYKKEIGRRIREARLEKGWTLIELSRRTKDTLSDTRISNYETGERMPKPSEAVLLGQALGRRPAYLMAVDDVQLPITPQEEALIRFWRTLPENERMDLYRRLEQKAMLYRDPVHASRIGKEWTAPKTKAPKREVMAAKRRKPGR